MISELLSGLLVFSVLVLIIFSGQNLVLKAVNFFTFTFYENSSGKKISGLLENDIYIRKRSRFFHSVSSDLKKHNIAFWEESEDQLKILIYNIQTESDGKILKFSRYVLSPDNNPDIFSNSKEDSKSSIMNMIENEIYFLPSYKWSLLDLSDKIGNSFFFEKNGLYCLKLGLFDFYFP